MTDFERLAYSKMNRVDLMAILVAKILDTQEIAGMLKTEELEAMMSAIDTARTLKRQETLHEHKNKAPGGGHP